jgi:hypothetical protein
VELYWYRRLEEQQVIQLVQHPEAFPLVEVLPFVRRDLCGIPIWAPAAAEHVLDRLYGPDWQTPRYPSDGVQVPSRIPVICMHDIHFQFQFHFQLQYY